MAGDRCFAGAGGSSYDNYFMKRESAHSGANYCKIGDEALSYLWATIENGRFIHAFWQK
jgi:hypothetical protein